MVSRAHQDLLLTVTFSVARAVMAKQPSFYYFTVISGKYFATPARLDAVWYTFFVLLASISQLSAVSSIRILYKAPILGIL